jgi:hypothetical protein
MEFVWRTSATSGAHLHTCTPHSTHIETLSWVTWELEQRIRMPFTVSLQTVIDVIVRFILKRKNKAHVLCGLLKLSGNERGVNAATVSRRG